MFAQLKDSMLVRTPGNLFVRVNASGDLNTLYKLFGPATKAK